jgi:NADPH:quinone reductase-like Zn-dependent oxidoreductase
MWLGGSRRLAVTSGSFSQEQIAKSFGAEVMGVCSTRNLDMMHSIGADHVIDYKKEDFTRNGQQYELILAANGYHPISDYLRALSPEGALSPDGIHVVAGGSMVQLFQAAAEGRRNSKTGGQKMYVVSLVQNQKDLVLMKELLESGKVVPVIDGCYPLSETSKAFRYFEKVHPKGKVVITVEHNKKT